MNIIIFIILLQLFNIIIITSIILYIKSIISKNKLPQSCDNVKLSEPFEPYNDSYTEGFFVKNVLCSNFDVSESLNTSANMTFYNTTEKNPNKTDTNKTITISKDGNISGVSSLSSNNITCSNEFKISNKDNIKINGTEIFKLIYPIGCIFTTTDKNFRPATVFGGNWVNINEEKGADGEGTTENGYRFLVATSNKQDPDIGGSQYISIDSIPSHNHTFTGNESAGSFRNNAAIGIIHSADYANGVFSCGKNCRVGLGGNGGWSRAYGVNFRMTPSGTISNTGGGKAYWPLYYRVYYWKRIG